MTVSQVSGRSACAGIVMGWPCSAHAHAIPSIVVVLAAMPIVAAALSIVLGIMARSWLTGVAHVALVSVWIACFVAAAKFSQSDLLNWAPIAALALHIVVMVWLIAVRALRRRAEVVASAPRSSS